VWNLFSSAAARAAVPGVLSSSSWACLTVTVGALGPHVNGDSSSLHLLCYRWITVSRKAIAEVWSVVDKGSRRGRQRLSLAAGHGCIRYILRKAICAGTAHLLMLTWFPLFADRSPTVQIAVCSISYCYCSGYVDRTYNCSIVLLLGAWSLIRTNCVGCMCRSQLFRETRNLMTRNLGYEHFSFHWRDSLIKADISLSFCQFSTCCSSLILISFFSSLESWRLTSPTRTAFSLPKWSQDVSTSRQTLDSLSYWFCLTNSSISRRSCFILSPISYWIMVRSWSFGVLS